MTKKEDDNKTTKKETTAVTAGMALVTLGIGVATTASSLNQQIAGAMLVIAGALAYHIKGRI